MFKRSTQKVTLLVVAALGLGNAWTLAKAGQALGLWDLVDRVYTVNQFWFWIGFIFTRLVYTGVWGILVRLIVQIGQSTGWLWFKPERDYYPDDHSDDTSVDKSMEIILWLCIIFFAIVLAEVAVRFITATIPPYVPSSRLN